MNELIDRLTTEANLSPEQAHKAIQAIAGFVKEKFPMMGGAVDQLFGGGSGSRNDNDKSSENPLTGLTVGLSGFNNLGK